jgi:hypothetical protein
MALDTRNPDLTAALLEFNGEAVVYCRGISDDAAREYALAYARILENRAKGLETESPRIPKLFEPSRKLICSTLERMLKKHLFNT